MSRIHQGIDLNINVLNKCDICAALFKRKLFVWGIYIRFDQSMMTSNHETSERIGEQACAICTVENLNELVEPIVTWPCKHVFCW